MDLGDLGAFLVSDINWDRPIESLNNKEEDLKMESVIGHCSFCLPKDDNISLATTEVEKIIGHAVFNSLQTVKERL